MTVERSDAVTLKGTPFTLVRITREYALRVDSMAS